MSIGNLSSKNAWSSVLYDGTSPSSRFKVTTENQELILFTKKDAPTELANCNSVTISANATDLYVSILRSASLDKNDRLGTAQSYDFTDDPVFFVPADDSITISGISISGIKFSNDAGVDYHIQALGF